MPYLVDVSGRPVLFWGERRWLVDLGAKGGREKLGGVELRGTEDHNVLYVYERRIKKLKFCWKNQWIYNIQY